MIQFTSITKTVDRHWLFEWAAVPSTDFYRVVLWGKELARSASTSYVWKQQGYEIYPPPLEVVAGTGLVVSEQFQPYVVVQWYGVDCQHYEVQELQPDGNWLIVRSVQESGLWAYTFQTQTLVDGSIHNYRVVAVDRQGNGSIPTVYMKYVVCPPRPPAVNVTYSGGRIVAA